jgi:hypothetical protein
LSSTEFKEIRKEWKAKKKEEEQARKAEDERQRQSDGRGAPPDQHDQSTPVYGNMRTPLGPPPSMGGPQLPPIGYAPGAGGQSQPQYGQPSPAMEGMGQYATSNTQLYTNGNNTDSSYPQSPYAPTSQVYQQRCQPSPHSDDWSS